MRGGREGGRKKIPGQYRFSSPKIKCILEPERAEETGPRSDVERAAPALTSQFSEVLTFQAKR